MCNLYLLIAILTPHFITSQKHIVFPTNDCRNPNNQPGQCISFHNCPNLIKLIRKVDLNVQETQFLRKSRCIADDHHRQPYVCCTEDENVFVPPIIPVVTKPPEEETKPIWSNMRARSNAGRGQLLPEPPNCGPQSLTNRIYSGNQTALDQYPWMALLEYVRKSGEYTMNCGGSLINQRYVLTAGHCVRGAIEVEVGKLTKVRLGEYDISTEIDCIDGDCNDKVLRVDIEEIIPHGEYDPSNIDRHHDIALIRLVFDINYTDFIRPVCLPLPSQHPEMLNVGDQLIVAGWGRTLLSRQSKVKMQLAVPVQDLEYCARKFQTRQIRLVPKQMCAGGVYLKDSCDGDSGGPLMRMSPQNSWFLEGVVSFGNRCGLEGWPGVYTHIRSYIAWIRDTVRP